MAKVDTSMFTDAIRISGNVRTMADHIEDPKEVHLDHIAPPSLVPILGSSETKKDETCLVHT